ncbi:hypothetical protein HII31_03870, partial [Pseudocercospora fuligena]
WSCTREDRVAFSNKDDRNRHLLPAHETTSPSPISSHPFRPVAFRLSAMEDPLRRLQILQRDLIQFSETRLANLQRLQEQLDASNEDLKKLLERKKKNDDSRKIVQPTTTPRPDTLTIDDVEYRVRDEFREAAINVADELDLDEVEAAKLCIHSQVDESGSDPSLVFRAMIRFHEQRQALLDCLRLLLQLGLEDESEDDEMTEAFKEASTAIVTGQDRAAYWRKCVDGLTDIENFLKKMAEYKDKLVMTGQGTGGDTGEALRVQRFLLTRQHESLAAVLAYLIRSGFVYVEDYRAFLSKAAALEADIDITIHYLPVLISGASHFASDQGNVTVGAARELHMLFAAGNTRLQWKQSNLRAAATVSWLAEYNARFATGTNEPNQSEADRRAGEEARMDLFFEALKDKAFHFMLAAAAFLKPVTWHDPSRTGIVDFLVDNAVSVVAMPRASDDFSAVTMHELQVFTDAFVTNMPDALRKLKFEEDEKRRNFLPQGNENADSSLDLERFIVIMACAYQDDLAAAHDFWADKESNLYGFLRWVSQRLPTPRVAAFCQLLRSIACDDKSANNAHRFLLDETAMGAGRLRKAYAVSWNQIFSELQIYASNLKDRPAAPQISGQERVANETQLEEPETAIMLDSYLGLAAHICRTSPEARKWLLVEQSVHLGEVMFQLARSDSLPRIRACCLDLLTAMLTDKSLEVRNGMWVLLDSWISSSGLDGSNLSRAQPRTPYPAKQYLLMFATNGEAVASLLSLLNSLVSPIENTAEVTMENLPFPENLGAPHRHAGIDTYIDFVMDSIFAKKVPRMEAEGEASMVEIVRYECLNFVHQCLLTFNEDLVLLANTSNVAVEATMETKSFASYARLHPFARVMEWLFDKGVVNSLFTTIQVNLDTLDNAEPTAPVVQAVLRGLQILSLAWKLQPTYLDIVRPIIVSQTSKQQPVGSSTLTSIDEVLLTHLHCVLHVAQFTACKHVEISLESIALLQRIGSSRKLADIPEDGARGRSNRLIGLLSSVSTALTLELQQDFNLEDWDLERGEAPLKLVRAKAILDLILASLDASDGRPSVAHSLLGFACYEQTVDVLPQTAFATSQSLFHAIAARAADLQVVIGDTGYRSWMLSVKRGCLEVVNKLAVSPLTSQIVQPQLRAMDFLPALSRSQLPVSVSPFWDLKATVDPDVLLDSAANAIRDFMRIREAFFEFAAADLRTASKQSSFSVQEKIVSALLGTIKLPAGENLPTSSIFDLLDFFDLETANALEPNYAQCLFFRDVDLSSCIKDDPRSADLFDIGLATELLTLRKRELKESGVVKEASELERANDETNAILASLISQNSWLAIHDARTDALEAWTELLSLIITRGGLNASDVIALSLQGLLIVLPKFEKSLNESPEATGLLAKLTLTLTEAISPASHDASQHTANVAIERLLTIFRVSLKVLADGDADLALRDVCYRTSCSVLASLPITTGASSSASHKQLLSLVQNAGERLLTVVTEDAFSGRGVTRVSALLFLDGLVSLYQGLKVTSTLLKALMRLNFVPVLVDTSIAGVAEAFKNEAEMVTTLAFYHTALALLLRLCQTSDGTALVLNSALFATIEESRLFSTDPDIGLDIDNTMALREFHRILAALLRIITAAVLSKGAQPGRIFLQQHRYTIQAIFKQAAKGQAIDVADELSRLILATDFLEDDEASMGGASRNGFS